MIKLKSIWELKIEKTFQYHLNKLSAHDSFSPTLEHICLVYCQAKPSEAMHHTMLCDNIPWDRRTNAHLLQIGNQQKPKVSVQAKSNLVNQWVIIVGLFTETEMNWRQQNHHSLPQHEWQLTKSGNQEWTTQPISSFRGWRMSFPSSPIILSVFPTAWLVSDFFPDSSTCLKIFLSSPYSSCMFVEGEWVWSVSWTSWNYWVVYFLPLGASL